MVWHAPLYIPLKVFKQIEAILNSFVWGNGRHKLAWHVLKNPADMGGVFLISRIITWQLNSPTYTTLTKWKCNAIGP